MLFLNLLPLCSVLSRPKPGSVGGALRGEIGASRIWILFAETVPMELGAIRLVALLVPLVALY